ncbi:MAG: twin-arginine translocase TatA/TatE family subunit [Verrucomicrobiota bacterium]|nr:twin-arginine translocase TatA/TatE family subunit [Verrucomicrobiota bacterium]
MLLILLIAILIFGAARIPEIARALGKAIRDFKKGATENGDEPKPAAKNESKDRPEEKI